MGWFKNALTRFRLTDYGTNGPLPTADTEGGKRDVAHEQPVTRDILAGGLADWPDDVYDQNPTGHALIRRCPPILTAIEKRARGIAKVDWTVRGGNPARAEAFKEWFDGCIGWPSYFAWMEWAWAEGYRVHQIKEYDGDEDKKWTVADWRMGGRRKWKAGPTDGKGTVHWDGTRLSKVKQVTPIGVGLGFTAEYEPEQLPRNEFAIYRPGSGSNPEGDMDLMLILLDIATDWKTGRLNASKYVEIYGVPIRGYEKNMENTRPGAVSGVMDAVAAKISAVKAGGTIAMPTGDALKLFQPQGSALTDLWAHMRELAGLVWLLLLDNKLTQDTADAGGTGSSTVGLSEKDIAILVAAMGQAEVINTDIVPWAAERNDFPKLNEGEEECYFWPEPPKATDAGEIEAGDDEDTADADPLEAGDSNPAMDDVRMGVLRDTLESVACEGMTPAAAKLYLRESIGRDYAEMVDAAAS